jgi:hypothetical protein
LEQDGVSAQQVADGLLQQALDLDDGRPHDDISVLVLHVIDREGDDVRRLTIQLPI